MAVINIGIDPGFDGAVACIKADGEVQILDAPTVAVKSSSGKKRRMFDIEAAMSILCSLANPEPGRVHAVLEAVHSMPKQGVASSFQFGHGLGVWEGLLVGMRIPYTLVPPQRWKKVMMDGYCKDKTASRMRAKALFPAYAHLLNLAKHDGRAEALLMARYSQLKV